jgi:Zn-dependent protease with chaperone function
MDFFAQQDAARRRTGWLVVCFLMAVVAIVVALYLVAVLILAMGYTAADESAARNPYAESFWHADVFGIVALVTLGVILLGTLYKRSQLAAGGKAVAQIMGGRLIDQQTRDLAERRLLNVVEEMALASGVPVPPVYVLDDEPSINAFAAGHEPGDAVIGVSRGCVEYLNRDELQGVMAHEFSHVLNGDMRLNLRLMGVLHGILVIALIGWVLLRSMGLRGGGSRGGGRGSGKGTAIIAIVGLAMLVIGSVGLFFAKLIKSGVSRQREYLADASAVQFTRLPDGIAGALKKIGGRPQTSKINNARAEEISHMFFGSAFGSFAWRLFATHPPLVKRIQQIEPTFDGTFPKQIQPVTVTAAEAERKPDKKRAPLEAILGGAAKGTTPMDPTGVLGRAGVLGSGGLLLAAAMLEEIPDPLREAARRPDGARAVIYALLLDRDAEMRHSQLDALKPQADPSGYQETERLAPLVDALQDQARMPLIQTTFPALKALSREQYDRFRQNVAALIQADGKVDLFEYTVHAMVLRFLDVHFGLAKPPAVRHRQMGPLVAPVVGVLSTMAYAGSDDEAEIRLAFEKGMAEIGQEASLLPESECSVRNLDQALRVLVCAAPLLKKQILAACVACIAADGIVTPREGELVSAVSSMLGVPLPPIAATPA